jgi:hypothetical protein
MNDICAYSIWTYEKQISHDNYYQIVTHEICDDDKFLKWTTIVLFY